MKAEDLIIDKSGEREVIEEVGEVFPHVRVAIFAETLIVETIHLSNLAGFMVSS